MKTFKLPKEEDAYGIFRKYIDNGDDADVYSDKAIQIVVTVFHQKINSKIDIINLIFSNSDSVQDLIILILEVSARLQSLDSFMMEMIKGIDKTFVPLKPSSSDNPFGWIDVNVAGEMFEFVQALLNSNKSVTYSDDVKVLAESCNSWEAFAMGLYFVSETVVNEVMEAKEQS